MRGKFRLSMVVHMTEVWVNVPACVVVGVSGSHLVACRWDGLDDVPPLARGQHGLGEFEFLVDFFIPCPGCAMS